ncbi:hypothetical protein DFH07DRAFT_396813 [Mycena maculata]|uniref:Uncharacterized protein n=1 Tax=Mycena maculata TaxID=230809 RepID=A0AAD7JFJ8_9AGAR|nr:hypothetical protein DFH07DRAFT_396813 [Mycena maculata]
MPVLSVPGAALVAVFVESVLYGFYVATLLAALPILTRSDGHWKRRADLHWVTLGASVILFASATTNLAVAMWSNLNVLAFDAGPSGAELGWQNDVTAVTVGVQSLTGDLILIYRCWLIYSRSRTAVALPSLMWTAALVAEVGQVYSSQRTTSQAVESKGVVPWGAAFWSLTLAINIYSTSLIVWRIWRVDRETKNRFPLGPVYNLPQNPLDRAMRNIVDSGLLYTTAVILAFSAFITGSTLVYPAGAFEIQSVGIAFNFIIIRGARRRAETTTSRQLRPDGLMQFNGGSVDVTGSNFPPHDGRHVPLVLTVEKPEEVPST